MSAKSDRSGRRWLDRLGHGGVAQRVWQGVQPGTSPVPLDSNVIDLTAEPRKVLAVLCRRRSQPQLRIPGRNRPSKRSGRGNPKAALPEVAPARRQDGGYKAEPQAVEVVVQPARSRRKASYNLPLHTLPGGRLSVGKSTLQGHHRQQP